MFKFITSLFRRETDKPEEQEVKYLIAGLGNPGIEYTDTRHNAGFIVLDALAEASNTSFAVSRYGAVATIKYKGRSLVLLKPSTFMNLSGKAVAYWLTKEKIQISNLLVVVDDVALPFGSIRLRAGGNNGGHNGLKDIDAVLGTNQYGRLRFGIGSDFPRGHQVEYVLGQWSDQENKLLPEKLEKAAEAIRSFATVGIERTMNVYNSK